LKASISGPWLLCGALDSVYILRLGDYQRISSINLYRFIYNVCELIDGTFVIAADRELVRWDGRDFKDSGIQGQFYKGHSDIIERVIELKRDVIVSASGDWTLKIWRVSTCECVHTLRQHRNWVYGPVKLTEGYFASGSCDNTIRVWNEDGINISTYETGFQVLAMTKLTNGSIVTGCGVGIEVWRP